LSEWQLIVLKRGGVVQPMGTVSAVCGGDQFLVTRRVRKCCK